MYLLDYLPFFYVAGLVMYSLVVAYAVSSIFSRFGNSQRFWFFMLLVFNIYVLAYGVFSQFMGKHRGKLERGQLRKISLFFFGYAVFLLISIVAGIFVKINPLF